MKRGVDVEAMRSVGGQEEEHHCDYYDSGIVMGLIMVIILIIILMIITRNP